MVDMTLSAPTALGFAASTRARALNRMRLGDLGFRLLTRTAATIAAHTLMRLCLTGA